MPRAARAGWLGLALALGGCGPAALPPAAAQLDTLQASLGKAGAAAIAPDEYGAFLARLSRSRAELESRRAFPWWPFGAGRTEEALAGLAGDGARLLAVVEARREASRQAAWTQLAPLRTRIARLRRARNATGGFAGLGTGLARLDLMAAEAEDYFARDEFERAAGAAERAAEFLGRQEAAWAWELGRYADLRAVAGWNAMLRDLARWSAAHDAPAIAVSKADLRLTVYVGGRPVADYAATLGLNGFRQKISAGDGATPEGRYRVTAKRGPGQTRYHKALLLDYPNAEDRRRFSVRRASGALRGRPGIGGLIEIHGGVADEGDRTLGCIGLANADMDRVFERARPGTPVVIVGAVSRDNRLARLLAELAHGSHRDDASAQ